MGVSGFTGRRTDWLRICFREFEGMRQCQVINRKWNRFSIFWVEIKTSYWKFDTITLAKFLSIDKDLLKSKLYYKGSLLSLSSPNGKEH